jgi:hypothetical protein
MKRRLGRPSPQVRPIARRPNRLRADIRWGLEGAFVVAAFYCVLLLVLALLNIGNPEWSRGYSLLSIVGVYVGVAFGGGVLAGLLRPLLPTWPGSVVLGMLVTSLFFLTMRVLTFGFDPWKRWEYYGILLFAVVLGIPAGITIHRHVQPSKRGGSREVEGAAGSA